EVLYCVKQLQFEHIEEYWTSFWQPEDDLEDEELVEIPRFSLLSISRHFRFSKSLAFLTQSCRNFAKNAEHYLKKAMQGAPEIIQKKKIQAVKYMAQGLRRYTSLNHLAQAARAVLQKPDQVMAMYNDYIRVDMQQVQEQAGWVSGCDSLMVHHIHNAFKDNLQKMAPMEEWAEWLESIVDQPTDYPLFDDALPPLPPMSLNQQYIISNRQSEQIYDQKVGDLSFRVAP
ncbi:hypothetical protein TELCIR_20087, partial [Teladorsagia circumcincta]